MCLSVANHAAFPAFGDVASEVICVHKRLSLTDDIPSPMSYNGRVRTLRGERRWGMHSQL